MSQPVPLIPASVAPRWHSPAELSLHVVRRRKEVATLPNRRRIASHSVGLTHRVTVPVESEALLPETVVLCPSPAGHPPAPWAEVSRQLDDAGVRHINPDLPLDEGAAAETPSVQMAHWVATCAVAIAVGGAKAPVLLVAHGAAGVVLPALGFSQRAARRGLHGYVFVDADLPAAGRGGGDWPDAPVTYVASPDAPKDAVIQAALRGWNVVHVKNNAISTAVVELVTSE